MYTESLITPKARNKQTISRKCEKKNTRQSISHPIIQNTPRGNDTNTEPQCDNLKQLREIPVQEYPKCIYIFGAQQCVGLASMLKNSRSNTMYEKYRVESITKPQASAKDILRSCEQIKPTGTDKIILSVGENDTNPMELLYNLSYTLKRLENSKVILLGVNKSWHLNENKLNATLRKYCHNLKNCTFINCYKLSTKLICKHINFTIDTHDYNTKYLNLQTVLTESKSNAQVKLTSHKAALKYEKPFVTIVTHKNSSIKGVNKITPHKGTIPYYFKVTHNTRFKKSLEPNTQITPQDSHTFFL